MHMICRIYCHKIILLFCLFAITGCTKIDVIKLEYAVKHNYGREFDFSWEKNQILPDSILYDCDIIKRQLTIVSKVSKTLCPECLVNYLVAADYYISTFPSNNIGFVAIVTKDNKIDELQSLLPDSILHNVQVVQDVEDNYLKKQTIKSVEGLWNVFLLDHNHKIVLMGDPLTHESVKTLYDKTVTDILIKE